MKKENKKKYLKTNIISFIIGMIIFGSIGVYAVVTFSSNDVTYDNKESGLSSTNVKGAIDELYKTCTQTSADKVIEDNGLEKDSYECRYFFTGANPNNYITFNDEKAGWRIISVECDGTIKIMKIADINTSDNLAWDSSDSENWARPATLNTYLNGTYYNSLTSTARSQIVAKDWSIGAIKDDNDLSTQINNENSKKWNGKAALINVSEYIRTNSNISHCGTIALNHDNYNTCKNTTWMYVNSEHWWTLTSYDSTTFSNWVYMLLNGSRVFVNNVITNPSNAVRPVVYLSANVKLSGSGTLSDPYTIS